MQSAKKALQMLQSANNPNAMLQQMLQNNPRYGEVQQLLNAFNGNADTAIDYVCRQKGINKEEFLNMLNNM